MNYEKLRLKWKPPVVRVLFIGESRPVSGKFFYLGNSYLAQFTQEAFARTFNRNFLGQTDFLKCFRDHNCYLDDLCLSPINSMDLPQRKTMRNDSIPNLAHRISTYSPHAIIVVMKGIVPLVNQAIQLSRIDPVTVKALPFPRQDFGYDRVYVDDLCQCLKELKNLNLFS